MANRENQRLGIDELLKEKREEILRIVAHRKAHNVRIFGSVARGEATPESDIDFLVEFNPDASLWDHVGLWQDLSELLGREIDVCTEDSLREGIREDALRDLVAL